MTDVRRATGGLGDSTPWIGQSEAARDRRVSAVFGAARDDHRRRVQGKGEQRMDSFVIIFTIFVLALFVGFEVITKVPPLLHTPLMSGSNAISGITIIGAMIAVATPTQFTTVLGFLAVVFATVNVVGGFLVTHRMLGMFSSREKRG
jgi:H+-translocating NAD(P) transhydrogenase subunit alpha